MSEGKHTPPIERPRTWLCCHNCRWIESATWREPKRINADGFCISCGEPACDPFDADFPYDDRSAISKAEGRQS